MIAQTTYRSLCILVLFILGLTEYQQVLGQSDPCIGSRGRVEWKYWLGLTGSDLSILHTHVYYPQAPDGKIILNHLAAPDRFDEYFGAVLAGYIFIEETGNYVFNITGDNKAEFFLSPSSDPGQLISICNVPGPTTGEDHDKYAVQTSTSQFMEVDSFYYFELHLKERTGFDHATMYWKPPGVTTWETIPTNQIHEYTCDLECDVVGTPCDDGDPNTIDDRADGFCNCFGRPDDGDDCIGEYQEITTLIYDSIGGLYVDYLRNSAKFPLLPDRLIRVNDFKMEGPYGDFYGSYTRGYINIPHTGFYVFNLVANESSEFWLSTDASVDSLRVRCQFTGFTTPNQHHKYLGQTSDSIYLEKGHIYYFELLHKERELDDHIAMYWRTPFAKDDTWINIDQIYLFGYGCETACLPEGTPCDDLNPMTHSDTIDHNCNCVGIPCGGPCTSPPTYTAIDPCGRGDQHTNTITDSWLSCFTRPNPNPSRDSSHWIMYNFGQRVKLHKVNYWNYNVSGMTDLGAEVVAVDYSLNGSSWQTAGNYTWPEAPGNLNYTGDTLINIDGIELQYLLITILNTRSSGNCAGFSEIIFEIDECQPAGYNCDDGDPKTHYDMYDENCNCVGIDVLTVNDCNPNVLELDDQVYPTGIYDAKLKVASQATVASNSLIHYTARRAIVLQPGFETYLGSGFLAIPSHCPEPMTPAFTGKQVILVNRESGTIQMAAYKDDIYQLDFEIKTSGKYSISVEQAATNTIIYNMHVDVNDPGRIRKYIQFKNINVGQYELVVAGDAHRLALPFQIVTEN